MSADDAEAINKQIKNVYNTTANIATLMENQTSIIKNSIRQFDKLFKTHIDDIKNLTLIVRKGSSQININSFNANLMESIAEIEICLDDLLEITDLVFEAIYSGKTGVVSPQLVTPKNFIKSLETIKKNYISQNYHFH